MLSNRQHLDGLALLAAVERGHVFRTQSGCDMYQPRWDRSIVYRVRQHRVDRRVRVGMQAGFIQAPEGGFGTYALTEAGRAELQAAQIA